MAKHFKLSIVGGTFDHLHKGHQTLLAAAFAQSEQVIIGITTENLYREKSFTQSIESYHTRESAIFSYLQTHALLDHAKIISITDIYGNSLTEKNIEAIFVTEDNRANVRKINDERIKRGMHALEIVQVPLETGNDGEIITSSRIRKGEINREGQSYRTFFESQEQFLLPHSLREVVGRPIGTVFSDMDTLLNTGDMSGMIIAVGDVVTLSLIRSGNQADISIVDLKTRRNNLASEDTQMLQQILHHLETQNQHGTIEKLAIKTLQNAFANYFSTNQKQLIIVSGEEDLLAMPMILFAPLHSFVVYGQYNMGVVGVRVTEAKKKEIMELLRKFR